MGDYYRVINGDTRSLDYGSYIHNGPKLHASDFHAFI